MRKKKVSTIKNNIWFLKQLWEVCPSRVVMNFVAIFWDFAMWTFYSVIFMQYLFGTAEDVRSFKEVVWFIWIFVAVSMGFKAFTAWYRNCFVPNTDIKIHYHLNSKLLNSAKYLVF